MNNNGLDKLAQLSKERTTAMERSLFDTMANENQEMAPFLLCTADLNTNMYYAPITNFGYDILRKFLGADVESSGIIEFLRNKFPISVVEQGIVSEIYSKVEPMDQMPKPYMLLQLEKNGLISNVQQWVFSDFPNNIQGLMSFITTLNKPLAENISDMIQIVQKTIRPNSIPHLIFHSEHSLATNGRPTIKLIEIGFVLLAEKADDDFKTLLSLPEAIKLSYFATLSLLYERERYFQKALRMATKGRVVKYGDRKTIKEQEEFLKDLERNERFCVPYVQSSDNDDEKKSPVFSWYEMQQFTPSSMLNVLTYSPSLAEYEVKNLAKACFYHLCKDYWEPLEPEPVMVKSQLASALAIALDAAREVSKKIGRDTASIRAGTPYKFNRQIEVYRKDHISREYEDLLKVIRINYESHFLVKIDWGEGEEPFEKECMNPVKAIEDLCDACKSIDRGIVTKKIMVRDGRIHGDSHYGNFLVDASIPEDPLVITIDPTKMDGSEKHATRIMKLMDENYEITFGAQAKAYIENLDKDPAFDIAKILLSTACCYGLAYRQAFRILPASSDVYEFMLKREDSEDPVKLSDEGGISGSQLVTLDTPVQEEAWNYHKIAAETTLNEYERLLDRSIKGSLNHTAVFKNMAFIRLYLLTIRHTLSISKILFPSNVLRSFSMFLLACAFMGNGHEIVKDAIKDINNHWHVGRLRSIFKPFWKIN